MLILVLALSTVGLGFHLLVLVVGKQQDVVPIGATAENVLQTLGIAVVQGVSADGVAHVDLLQGSCKFLWGLFVFIEIGVGNPFLEDLGLGLGLIMCLGVSFVSFVLVHVGGGSFHLLLSGWLL